MDALIDRIVAFFTSERAESLARVVFILVSALVAARLAAAAVSRLLRHRASPQHTMVARRVTFVGIVGLAVVSSLRELGFDLSVLLGAAGILTVALGFASQTSASNLISGLFLIGEEPFVIGDTIRVGTTTGEVLSIDLMSVKLRTFDNLYVRVPNETMIKSEIVNLTHFPIRRVDLRITVDRREDLGRLRDLLCAVAEANPQCLEEPRPQFQVAATTDFSAEVLFCVWARREAYLEVKTGVQQECERVMRVAGVALPVPGRVVTLVSDQSKDASLS